MPSRYLAGAMPVAQPRASDRTGPDPSFFDSAAAAFRTTIDEQDIPQERRINMAYAPIEDALLDMGFDRATLRPRTAHPVYVAGVNTELNPLNGEALWTAIGSARARDPKAFASLPATREEFERGVLTRGGARRTDQATAARGGFTAQLAGGAVASFVDPINLATLPLGGGGKTIAQTILREAIVNMSVEAFEQPMLADAKTRMGETLTVGQAGMNVLTAGVAGGVLGGAGKAVELHAGSVGGRLASARESAIAGVWDRLPAPVRERWKSAAHVTDDDLPEIAEAAIGAGNLSADERAAMSLIVRERQIDAANPFVPNGAGVAAHREQLSDAIARVLADVPPAAPPTARARLSSSTAIASGSVSDVPARAALKNRIGLVESSGGRNYANPLSSARGKYQFLQSTWLHYYKQRFGAGGLSDAAILDKRTDQRLQDALMDDMTSENAAFLRRRGEAETAGNLYLVHFAGQGGARKLFEAEPGLRAADVLGEKVARANPWMKDMSASDVIRWAHRKMDEAPPARGGARVELADGADGERAGIQAELDRLQTERSALMQSPANDVAPDASDSAEAVLVDAVDALPEPAVVPAQSAGPIEPRAAAADAAPAETLALLPKLRDVVEDRSLSINQLGRLAKDLGVPEADIRRGFLELAKAGAILMNRKGQFARLPRDIGPVDALKFIGRMGVRDDEGHALVRGRNLQQLIPGAGPLIRPSGKSVDGIGEHLWDAGYFGPSSVVSRPDENAVLDMLERAANGEKIYPHGEDVVDRPASGMTDAQQVEYDQLADSYRAAAQDLEFGVDDALIDHAIRRYGDADPRDGLLRALNDAFDDAQLDVQFEKGEAHAGYDDLDDAAFRDPGWAGEDVGGRPGPDAGDARQGGAAGRVADAEADRAPLNSDSVRAFDDPDAQAAKAQVDSLDHDLRAMLRPADEDVSFTTAKGSTYRVEAGGTTTRDKMFRPEHGVEEQGPQPTSQATFYVSADDALKLAEFQAQGRGRVAIQRLPDGRAGVRYLDGKDAGKFERRTVVSVKKAPEMGLTPVEIWKDGERVHFGNEIVAVSKGATDPAIAARQAQQAALKADAPMRAAVDQETTIGSPLFDAVDQTRLQLDDGKAVTLTELFADLDAEEAAIKTVRDCL